MVKVDVIPIRRRMAGGTITPQLAVVLVVLLVTGVAIGWCALEDIVDMALLTGHIGVLSF